MFKELNKQGIQSDEGYIVQFVGRFEVEYRDGDKYISIYVEPGRSSSGSLSLIIGKGAFEKWANNIPISEEQQKTILANFTKAINYFGMEVICNN